MGNFNWAQFFVVGIIALVIGGVFGSYLFPNEIEKECETCQECPTINQTQGECETCLKCEVIDNGTPNEVIKFIGEGYTIDNLYLNTKLMDILSDKELNLFDGKVNFDGKDYDAEETLILKDIELKTNEEDFNENVYLTLPKNSIGYLLTFSSNLNTSKINKDETLEFNFLGMDYEVSNWNTNKVTLTKGIEHTMKPGETIVIDGKNVTLEFVTDDEAYLNVDGQSRSIGEDSTKSLNGLEIQVKDVFSSESYSVAIIRVGEDLETEIEDGEEYTENSIWEYVINSNSIGIILKEDFKELNDREGFDVLDIDETLCLPNDYLCVKYNGLSDENFEDYSFELEGGIIIVEGKFTSGLKDYDEIFINGTNGLIYEDDDQTLIITEDIFLGDSKLNLTTDGTGVYIDDLKIAIGLDSILVGIKELNSTKDNYRTDYGIVIENPEDNIEDYKVSISIPEEKLEGSISFGLFEEETETNQTSV